MKMYLKIAPTQPALSIKRLLFILNVKLSVFSVQLKY